MLGEPHLSGTGEILLGFLAAIAAIYDTRYRRIPNWLVLAGIVCGFAWNAIFANSPGVLRAAEGLGLGLLLYMPLYLIRGRRAGDVKLLAAVGAITGPGNCFWVFLLTAILGGLIALVVIAMHKRVGRTFFHVAWIVKDLSRFQAPHRSSPELDVTTDKGLRLPHAALMAVGVAAFVLMTRYGVAI